MKERLDKHSLMEGTKIVFWFVNFVIASFETSKNTQVCSDCKVWNKTKVKAMFYKTEPEIVLFTPYFVTSVINFLAHLKVFQRTVINLM